MPEKLIQPVLSVEEVYERFKIVDRLGQGGSGTVYLVVPSHEIHALQEFYRQHRPASASDRDNSKPSKSGTTAPVSSPDLALTRPSGLVSGKENVASEAKLASALTEFPEAVATVDDLDNLDNEDDDIFEAKENEEPTHTQAHASTAQKAEKRDHIPRSFIRRAVVGGVVHAYVLKHIVFGSDFESRKMHAMNADIAGEGAANPDEIEDDDTIASFERELLQLIRANPQGITAAARHHAIFSGADREFNTSSAALLRAYYSCATARRRALCEALCLASLQHPQIISLVSAYIAPAGAALLIEWGVFGDLDRYLRAARTLSAPALSEQCVIRCIAQLALALSNLHENRILHRDLKSPNVFLALDNHYAVSRKGRMGRRRSEILLSSLPEMNMQQLSQEACQESNKASDEGEAVHPSDKAHAILVNSSLKIGDFGTAHTLTNSEDQAKTQIGTPYYLSPEICEGKSYGTESDIWALGIIAYELMTFNRPFVGTNIAALVYQILNKPPPEIPEDLYSKRLRKLAKQMLSKNPSKRPTAAEILAHPAIAPAVKMLQQERGLSDPNAEADAKPTAKRKTTARKKREREGPSSEPTEEKPATTTEAQTPSYLSQTAASKSKSARAATISPKVEARRSPAETEIACAQSPKEVKPGGVIRRGPTTVSKLNSTSGSKQTNPEATASLAIQGRSTNGSNSTAVSTPGALKPSPPAARTKVMSGSTLRAGRGETTAPSSHQALAVESRGLTSSQRAASNVASTTRQSAAKPAGRLVLGSTLATAYPSNSERKAQPSGVPGAVRGVTIARTKTKQPQNEPVPGRDSTRSGSKGKSPGAASTLSQQRASLMPWQCRDCCLLNQPHRSVCLCCASPRPTDKTSAARKPTFLEAELLSPQVTSSQNLAANPPTIDEKKGVSVSWRDLHIIASQVRESIEASPDKPGDDNDDSGVEEEKDHSDADDDVTPTDEDDLDEEQDEDAMNDPTEGDSGDYYEDDFSEGESEQPRSTATAEQGHADGLTDQEEPANVVIWECPNCRFGYEVLADQTEITCTICDVHFEWGGEGN